jgi:hypothetical protein
MMSAEILPFVTNISTDAKKPFTIVIKQQKDLVGLNFRSESRPFVKFKTLHGQVSPLGERAF